MFVNFAQGLKFMADFHSKMSVCRHELGGGTHPPPTIPTLVFIPFYDAITKTLTIFSEYSFRYIRSALFILRQRHCIPRSLLFVRYYCIRKKFYKHKT